jgi:hypothetical protein
MDRHSYRPVEGTAPASVNIAVSLSVESARTARAVSMVGEGNKAPCKWQAGLKNYCKLTVSDRLQRRIDTRSWHLLQWLGKPERAGFIR